MNLFSRAIAATKNLFTRLASLVTGYSPDTRVSDDGDWNLLSGGGGPTDRRWRDIEDDLRDALEAWRKNFLVRQIVRLLTAYVVGDGITVSSERRQIARFVAEFWGHRQNRIEKRLPAWCDELTRAGGLFPVLFTNPVDGMSYVRAIPASSIIYIDTDPEDYERELEYHERVPGQLEPKKWKSVHTAKPTDPMMLHYPINRAVGATRGEGDLGPVLPWAKRYAEWLKDRVRFNRLRTELTAVELRTRGDVEKRKKDIQANPPTDGNIVVTVMGEEELIFHAAKVEGANAEPDGRAQRLAVATAANVPLHFFAEGDTANRATAVEMGDPTHRFYRVRQNEIVWILKDLVEQAYRRKATLGLARMPANEDLKLTAETPDISRADNAAMATAAATIVGAFAVMKAQGWITDELAIRLAFKFAGEILDEETINEILESAEPEPPAQEPADEEEGEDQMSKYHLDNWLLTAHANGGANGTQN